MTRDPASPADLERLEQARRQMIERDLIGRGIHDRRVLEAMGRVRRELFVGESQAAEAYGDSPLPIGCEQTISQPYIVAAMAEAAQVPEGGKVLDVGTGSGYAAAVYAELGAQVFSVERIAELAREGEAALRRAGYGADRVQVRHGDGYLGWPEASPFDAVLVAATAERPPDALLDQMRVGGTMIIPIRRRGGEEVLERWRRVSAVRYEQDELFGVRFVPLVRGQR